LSALSEKTVKGQVSLSNLPEKTVWVTTSTQPITLANHVGTVSAESSEFMCYRDSNGQYVLRMSIGQEYSAADGNFQLHLTGIVFANYSQGLAGMAQNGASAVTLRRAASESSSDQISLEVLTGVPDLGTCNKLQITGDVLLASKPSWFDANREAGVSIIAQIDEATATTAGLVKILPIVKYSLTSTGYTSNATMDFDTEDSSLTRVGTWANTNGSITVPEDGTYEISINAGSGTGWATNNELWFRIAGSNVNLIDRVPSSSTTFFLHGQVSRTLSSGDLITISATGSTTLNASADVTSLTIRKIGP
jgi:hypothetical protein